MLIISLFLISIFKHLLKAFKKSSMYKIPILTSFRAWKDFPFKQEFITNGIILFLS